MSIFATMSWTVLPLCLLGTAAGIVFGFLPGLSATMGVALLMPFTFNMGIMDSMALLLGVYCGGIYGGSITAILIRTPGTPAAAATVLDGYPLTQKGKAKEALSAATLGSTLGGLFSCVILILLARVVAAVALKFGAQEYFAVGIFGMSMVTALSGKNLRKGIISALLGLTLGVKMPNLTWTSEIAPIKQSGSVMIALFGGWAYALALGGLYLLFAARVMSAELYLLIFAAVTAVASALLYSWLKTRGARIFAAL